MQIIVSAKNMELTKSLKSYVEKKLGVLEKYFNHILEIDVNLSFEDNKDESKRQVANVTLFANGIILRGKHVSHDMYASIDLVSDKMEKQIVKFKEKLRHKPRRDIKHDGDKAFHSIIGKQPVTAPEKTKKGGRNVIEVEVKNQIASRKIIRNQQPFSLKPMFVEEAADQLENLKQEFLVFSNADTKMINVIYRRPDGNMGLIEPEFK